MWNGRIRRGYQREDQREDPIAQTSAYLPVPKAELVKVRGI